MFKEDNMPFKIFKRNEEIDEELDTKEEEDYLEVNVLGAKDTKGKILIKIEKLNDFADTERVLRLLREGSIVFLKIKNLREKDIGELKRAVEKLKKSVIANNGDIAGVEENWLVLTPEYAAVERE